jgi:hypothetical protein
MAGPGSALNKLDHCLLSAIAVWMVHLPLGKRVLPMFVLEVGQLLLA